MKKPKNPIVPGWYADPEARFYEGKYYIYVTRSFTDYKAQMNLDAFSSVDGEHWEKHEGIIQMEDFPWVWRAVWAPTIIEKNGKYFLIFAVNDIQSDAEEGGLIIAASDSPAGPFTKWMDGHLIDRFINGAQPIDAHLFKDDDGTVYLYYGGWKHCNVAIMNEEMNGFVPMADGSIFKEITPDGYVEGPCMLKRNGVYHFMWSEGNWGDGSYRVRTAVCETPFAVTGTPYTILSAQEGVAEGPGHHGFLQLPGTDEWKIVYHRRNIGDKEAGNRMLCIDDLLFDGDRIEPVLMT
ncbi:family 43 glycosylhydrolase [Phocea massiliensis]|uniref:Family 43 glycosylhydrolase n=1 Tax=Merdimmobilis hominis TaxID=2897707 RepID=A0A938X8G7_9FIRM|nr:glycoside hydrolase family 43 protein [Merdimmobilis hominis]MBM6921141.1 family 43 glycosylhydrolase [Merdimmobilis hominis]